MSDFDEPRMGDAFEGSAAEWQAYVESLRQAHQQAQQPRNPKAGPVKAGDDPWEIDNGAPKAEG